MTQQRLPVLEVKELSVKFRQYGKGLKQEELEVISSIDIDIHAGEILGVVGSSGSGKSLLAHAILGILPGNAITHGTMKYCGEELTKAKQQELRGKEIALIPQAVTYLDPLMKIGAQVQGHRGSKEAQRQVFKKYGLKTEAEAMYPFQLSGGMARRVLVSAAVISDARLIIADEPTPGLDEKIAEEAMGHLRQLADEGRAVMLITHDLELAFKVTDRVAVFYGGTTVEVAPTKDFIQGGNALRHPYSKALWEALPQNGFKPIEGFQPFSGTLSNQCIFSPRCSYRTEECSRPIAMRELRGGTVRCCHGT